jgi:diguanylate cyclase (GGDEF)-like protein
MKPLFKLAIWIVVAALLLHTGLFAPSQTMLTFAFYAALIAGLLIAWRFHSSRIFLALLVLFLAEHAIAFFSSGHLAIAGPGRMTILAIGFLLPLNFILLSFQSEKGFIFPTLGPAAMLLFVECVVVAVLSRPDALVGTTHAAHRTTLAPLPYAIILVFAAAAIILLTRFVLFRKPAESGLLWAMIASFLALYFGGAGRIASGYFATAAIVLAVSMVETSYQLAYHDELTTLPSRRAFHEALLALVPPYSIAMVDIDHFKRCNDTYGHDTGDQVLRMVASRLARVTGGGQAYRCGGEEFTILFPGKMTKEILGHLEQLRASIEASSFRLRGSDRRQIERGPDRRNLRATAGRGRAGHVIRQMSQATPPTDLSVTASIGVASSGGQNSSPEQVIAAADQALYRAKAAGRNRIETTGTPLRRVRKATSA